MVWKFNIFGDSYDKTTEEYTYACPKCKKKFRVTETTQTPGFRMREECICPYCDEVVKTSMSVEFDVEKMD